MKKEMKFEEAINRLEEINKVLEKGEISLEESLVVFEEGVKLSSICYDKLKNAKQKIEEVDVKSEV